VLGAGGSEGEGHGGRAAGTLGSDFRGGVQEDPIFWEAGVEKSV